MMMMAVAMTIIIIIPPNPQSPSSYPRHLEGSSLHTVSNCVDLHTARVSRRHAGDDLDEGQFKKNTFFKEYVLIYLLFLFTFPEENIGSFVKQ